MKVEDLIARFLRYVNALMDKMNLNEIEEDVFDIPNSTHPV